MPAESIHKDNTVTLDQLSEVLDSGAVIQAKNLLNSLYPSEIADVIESTPRNRRDLLWTLVSDENKGETLAELNDEVREYLIDELIARIKALLRRSSDDSKEMILSYGNIKLDTDSHRVYCCDEEAKLGPREYRILEFLMKNPGRVYSRQQILDNVWGTNVYVTDRTIDVHIRRLRKALSNTEECKVIRTIRSSGYSLDTNS